MTAPPLQSRIVPSRENHPVLPSSIASLVRITALLCPPVSSSVLAAEDCSGRQLARHGYVVAAPDHKDAVCAIGSDELKFGNMRTDQSFLEPKRWNERSEIDRLHDLRLDPLSGGSAVVEESVGSATYPPVPFFSLASYPRSCR